MSMNKDGLKAWFEDSENETLGLDAAADGYDDALINAIGRLIEKRESQAACLNPKTLLKIKRVYELMRKEFAGTDVRVTYGLHDPYPSMGFVELEGPAIEFCNTGVLRECMELASNSECYSLVKGDVRYTFTFHGLTNVIK